MSRLTARCRRPWAARLAGALRGLAACGLLHGLLISLDGLHNSRQRADTGVVLGNKVNEDGTLSERLRQRLACGLQLYRRGQVQRLLVSGGLGKEGFYEGDKMRDYLRAHGVPAAAILVDNHGDNTQLTAQNAGQLQRALPLGRVLVVSQFYHLSRTKLLLRQAGLEVVGSASPAYYEWRDAYSLLREWPAYYVALLRGTLHY